ncbi:cytoplasmic dynein 2 light intermediate chain 1 [Ostrinia furnacalis]|uniref:cytoplasmic dynein 2 light intermediate chain 1 n=1 Tax=Ostrinia furnacalis TaxID=93504 RepID=UPI00103D0AD9|nr:cytoplasmic dynein 2 light intermediate chain 1 [Ostrinia furnacalis]
MLSIPEIAASLVEESLTNISDDNSCSICLVGSSSAGKSTLLNTFLDRNDTPRETLVMEYSFGRKTNQKQGIEKTICHVWEYGGKLETFKNILPSIPVMGKFFYCIMIDLAKIKSLWYTLETCIEAMLTSYAEQKSAIELLIIGSKYDIFKNYDAEIKKLICTTLRSVALLFKGHIVFYSSKEPNLVRRAKDILHGIGFGNGVPNKDKIFSFTKPLMIPKGTDSWDNVGVTASTLEQVKAQLLSRISFDTELPPLSEGTVGIQQAHLESSLDAKVAMKFEELRNLDTLDISLGDYLLNNFH